MNKTFSKIISFFLVGILALSLAACAENADAMKAKDTPDYATTLSNFETHQTAYSEFMNAGDGNIFYKQTEGFTPAENYCTATYIESEDGVYMNCDLEIARNDRAEHDEYFRYDDTTMYIVRSYIDPNDSSVSIQKYVVINGTLYFLNSETETVEPVAKPDSLDMFLSFSEIKTLFGNIDE